MIPFNSIRDYRKRQDSTVQYAPDAFNSIRDYQPEVRTMLLRLWSMSFNSIRDYLCGTCSCDADVPLLFQFYKRLSQINKLQ